MKSFLESNQHCKNLKTELKIKLTWNLPLYPSFKEATKMTASKINILTISRLWKCCIIVCLKNSHCYWSRAEVSNRPVNIRTKNTKYSLLTSASQTFQKFYLKSECYNTKENFVLSIIESFSDGSINFLITPQRSLHHVFTKKFLDIFVYFFLLLFTIKQSLSVLRMRMETNLKRITVPFITL